MGKVKELVEQVQLAPTASSPNKIVAEKIRSQWHKIEAVMPKHMTSERFLQLTVSAVNHEPKLLECDFVTLMSCVMRCSALGLEPSAVDGLGRAYILPYRNGKTGKMEATFILGYKGMLELARRSGEVLKIEAHAVHAGDDFMYRFGLDPYLAHTPRSGGNKDNMTHVYMIAWLKNSPVPYFDVMTKGEVEDIRKRSRAKDSGAWVTDYEEMAKKTVLRRSFKYLPVSVDAQSAAATDETDGGFTAALELEPLMASGEDGQQFVSEVNSNRSANGTASAQANESQVLEHCHEQEGRKAICATCGNEIENASPDAMLDDLNQFLCCQRPDYRWA